MSRVQEKGAWWCDRPHSQSLEPYKLIKTNRTVWRTVCKKKEPNDATVLHKRLSGKPCARKKPDDVRGLNCEQRNLVWEGEIVWLCIFVAGSSARVISPFFPGVLIDAKGKKLISFSFAPTRPMKFLDSCSLAKKNLKKDVWCAAKRNEKYCIKISLISLEKCSSFSMDLKRHFSWIWRSLSRSYSCRAL